jgi:hypothetical protein
MTKRRENMSKLEKNKEIKFIIKKIEETGDQFVELEFSDKKMTLDEIIDILSASLAGLYNDNLEDEVNFNLDDHLNDIVARVKINYYQSKN